jgi:hypothetical protein
MLPNRLRVPKGVTPVLMALCLKMQSNCYNLTFYALQIFEAHFYFKTKSELLLSSVVFKKP